MFEWSNDGKPDYSTHLAVFQSLFREKNKKTAQNNFLTKTHSTHLKSIFLKTKFKKDIY